ncbi:hypothetical protein ACPCHT_00300 [Nucisporomicrobium flavum]|uniref:hypothetical protein n=1 Tax=Nucisporomicrobium flavum TaxID=2785915 RepID=UPI003C2F73BE
MRHGWRDTVRAAADMALLGFLVTGAALPVVTAGAAVATGSAAIRHHLDHDTWPAPQACLRTFRRALLPGLAASAAAVLLVALVIVDVLALRSGAVPGAPVLMVPLLAVAAAGLGFAGLLAVAASGPAPLATARTMARPAPLAAATAVVMLTLLLAALVHPVLIPPLIGYGLFALHVLARRTGATVPGCEQPASTSPRSRTAPRSRS